MPIYEYQCDACGKIEEAIQKFTDKPLTRCNHCAGQLHKLISQSSFHLKGSGWYVTDYAGKKQNQSNNTDNTAAAKDAGDKKPAVVDSKKPDSE